ncbi:MAG: peptide-modifying radical SAM enzyme CbpB [Candidatus Melainabacteria bacterium GWF2_37_15]|nr:MAG: peptide-modifying radical SAM enzyme CbpB [Candidatus Melainabacteria bacterium GWF2_37_15]
MFSTFDIKHPDYVALIEPDNAFWALVEKNSAINDKFVNAYKNKAEKFSDEMQKLRFGLALNAVYINPTSRCNLNCVYCYIPQEMRKHGDDMSRDALFEALEKLSGYFKQVMPENRLPQIIFHGAEPLLVKEVIFPAIEKFQDRFRFGVQTNGVLLDDEAIEFLTVNGVGIGLSLDAPIKQIADKTRKTWGGDSVFENTIKTIHKLKGYDGYNVITTVTKENMHCLCDMIDFFHELEIPAVMLNMVRCTLPGAREVKPDDYEVAQHFIKALDRTHELYKKTGRKIVVANFANILVSIMAPMARRLMCDISPCGGGRVFFALAPDGGMFPCSEFIGLPDFKGGNLFRDDINTVLQSESFKKVTDRKIEDIKPCDKCAIRHFCGAPCPAEAYEMNGGMNKIGAFCEFYEEQVRYAFRLIADNIVEDYLWSEWDKDTVTLFEASALNRL